MQTTKHQENSFTQRELVDALMVIQESRDDEIIIERKDDTIIWRGDGELSQELSRRIKKNKSILVDILGHNTVALEQASLYAMFADEDLDIGTAFSLVATKSGLTGGREYGYAITGRIKPH